ncbi:MAG: hypothetical protein IJD89_05600 [Clostridia bacterium]|nr:hypothetical protein [Clostridia bacterium]
MKKLVVVLAAVVVLAGLMFAEYRYIMCNLRPYYAEDNSLCIEFMGQVDTYYVE